jgi:hypothetical protein
VLGTCALAFVLYSGLSAQSVWTGSISSNVLTSDNWSPAVQLTETATTAGPNITVPRIPLKPGNLLYDNVATLSGAQNIAVRSLGGASMPNNGAISGTDSVDLDVDGIKETRLSNSKFIVNLDAGYVFTVQNGTTATNNQNWYPGGTIIVKSGTLTTSRPIYMTSDSSTFIVEGNGILTTGTAVFGGNGGAFTANNGGQLIVRGNGQVTFGGWNGRTTRPSKGPQIYITENGKITMTGQINFTPHIRDSNKITGLPDYYPVTKIDVAANRTYLWAVPNNQLLVGQTDKQTLTAGAAGSLVSVVLNQAWKDCDPNSFVWKYTTTPGGPYVAFSPNVQNDSIYPVFTVSGTLYLVCQANKISDGSLLTTNEVKFVVGSNKAILSPNGAQYLRLGQTGAPITVTETGTLTSREWKYSTTSEGPYISFSPAQTGATYTPNFDATGDYFVVCESTLDGTLERSGEILINYDTWTGGARSLVWTGTSGSAIGNAANWNPIAYIHRNNITVPTGVSNMPLISNAGPDTIGSLAIQANANLTINKPSLSDTLNIRTDNQNMGDGQLIIQSGTVHASAGIRIVNNPAKIIVQGSGSLIFRQGLGLAFGGNPVTSGGKLIVSDNGLVKHDVGPYRISTNKADTFSRTFIKGHGQVWFLGDQITTIKGTWIPNKKILPDTLSADTIFYIYDAAANYSKVWVYDTTKFCIKQYARQFVGRNQPAPFNIVDATGLSNLQWYYRKNAADGKNIDNADAWTLASGASGTSANIAFPETGEYFVKCIGTDGSSNPQSTLNFGRAVVVAVDVAPAETQSIAEGAPTAAISRISPLKSTGEWKYSTTLGSNYQSFVPAVIDTSNVSFNFEQAGLAPNLTYYIVFETSTAYTDDDAKPVIVYSNPVQINYGNVGIVQKRDNLSIYPNPTSGNFKVNAGTLKSFTLEITDVAGKVVYSKKYSNTSSIESVSINKKGLYLVKLISGEKVRVSRLIVK